MGRKIFLILALIVMIALIGINIYINKVKNVSQESSKEIPQVTPQPNQQTKEIITPVVASEPILKDSPDGKLTPLMNSVKDTNGTTYTFSVLGKEIFVKTVDSSTVISVPYNTWSPNGKYVFLKEENTLGIKFFVLSAQTLSSDQNDETANITDLFTKKYPDLKIGDVTGWGGVNVVIVNSVKSDGSRGASFWFEMPSHYISQLSTRF